MFQVKVQGEFNEKYRMHEFTLAQSSFYEDALKYLLDHMSPGVSMHGSIVHTNRKEEVTKVLTLDGSTFWEYSSVESNFEVVPHKVPKMGLIDFSNGEKVYAPVRILGLLDRFPEFDEMPFRQRRELVKAFTQAPYHANVTLTFEGKQDVDFVRRFAFGYAIEDGYHPAGYGGYHFVGDRYDESKNLHFVFFQTATSCD